MDTHCPRCGSEKMIPNLPLNVEVYTGGGGLYGVTVEKGGGTADVHVGRASGRLTVKVCGKCGHAELRAENFRLLYENYEKSQQS